MKFRRASLALIVSLSMGGALFAQDEDITFSGEHRAGLSIPAAKQHFDFEGELKSPRMETDLELEAARSNVSLHAGIRVKSLLVRSESQSERFSWYPLENSLTIETGRLSTTLGCQYFSWGSADRLNPTDNINPRDYNTGPDAEKLSIFAASAQIYFTDRLSLPALYVPFEEPDRFPVRVADKLPQSLFSRVRLASLAFGQNGLVIAHEPVARASDVRIDDPEIDPSSFIAGARMKLNGPLFDLSASYLYDMDPYYTPRIALASYSPLDAATQISHNVPAAALAALPTDLRGLESITLRRGRIHRIGLDAKTVMDRFGLWLEGCYSLTDDFDNSDWRVRNHSLDWTLGLDFTWGPADEHYINLQQIGRYVIDYDDTFEDDYPDGTPSMTHLASRAAMEEYYYRLLSNRLAYVTEGLLCGAALRSEWSFFDGNLKPSLEVVYLRPFRYDESGGKRIGDVIGTAELSWKPLDAVGIDLGVSGYYSAVKSDDDDISNLYDSKIGLFYPHSRVFLNTVFTWTR